jgi:hypothetical protein
MDEHTRESPPAPTLLLGGCFLFFELTPRRDFDLYTALQRNNKVGYRGDPTTLTTRTHAENTNKKPDHSRV